MVRRWWRIAVASGCLGCVGADVASDAGGPRRVENDAPTAEEVVQAREVLRIGSVDGAGPSSFGRIDDVEAGGGGVIYVVDGLAQEVRVFDENGGYLRSMGGPGSGPGEFRSITGITVGPGEALWVWDIRAARFSVFDTAGSLMRTVRREWHSTARSWPGRFLENGSLMDLDGEVHGLDLEQTATQEIAQSVTPVLYDDSVRVVDSLPPLEWPMTAVGGNYMVPFQRGLVQAFDATGGVWFAYPSRYQLVRRERNGDTTVVVSLPFSGNPVTTAERDSVIRLYRERLQVPLDPDLIPEGKPVLSALLDLGEGWVGVLPEGPGVPVGRVLDVFDDTGVHRARVDLGLELEVVPRPVYRDGVLFGVWQDELDVPYVVGLTWDGRSR